MRRHSFREPLAQPLADRLGLLFGIFCHLDQGRHSVEHGHGAAAPFAVAVHVGNFRPEQTIGLHANLMGRAVIDAQGAGAATDIPAQ
ncbi:MAG: hypothetical protein L0H83_13950 [Salinisphaera sp.]|nr:hypothetical protein [Salinisphaera sp.]